MIEARRHAPLITRRSFLAAGMAAACVPLAGARAQTGATFLFIADVHACRMGSGLSPMCEQEGKTDANLLRHIRALNGLPGKLWPAEIAGKPTGLTDAGKPIETPLGVVVGGDMTDDGGGQVATPGEGSQLLQFSQRYQMGSTPDQIHFRVYVGLGNHDLDQDGAAPNIDWYRRELRDYVELNHRPSAIFKPLVPADNYDIESDSYSWNWSGLHLVQLLRFGGDTNKGAMSGLNWLKHDLATYAADGRPVVLFQHYGWDDFSRENWDPSKATFDDEGAGSPHWWSDTERQALLDALAGYRIAAIFHGHEHDHPMVYRAGGHDIVKPKAAYMGGFALVHVTPARMSVVLGEAADDSGGVVFTDAYEKALA